GEGQGDGMLVICLDDRGSGSGVDGNDISDDGDALGLARASSWRARSARTQCGDRNADRRYDRCYYVAPHMLSFSDCRLDTSYPPGFAGGILESRCRLPARLQTPAGFAKVVLPGSYLA